MWGAWSNPHPFHPPQELTQQFRPVGPMTKDVCKRLSLIYHPATVTSRQLRGSSWSPFSTSTIEGKGAKGARIGLGMGKFSTPGDTGLDCKADSRKSALAKYVQYKYKRTRAVDNGGIDHETHAYILDTPERFYIIPPLNTTRASCAEKKKHGKQQLFVVYFPRTLPVPDAARVILQCSHKHRLVIRTRPSHLYLPV